MRKLLGLLTVLVFTPSASAGTDVDQKLDQLKNNKINSESNYNQYKDNLKISKNNVIQATKAVKELKYLKKQLSSNGKNVDKNKQALLKNKNLILKYKQKELSKRKIEEAEIAQLHKIIENLQANIKKRDENIKSYDNKIAEIDLERLEWDQQNGQLAELKQKIQTRTIAAESERVKWLKKKKEYRVEANKWHKQSKKSARIYNKLDALK